MRKLKMLFAAAVLGGGAALMPAAAAQAQSVEARVGNGIVSVQYGERYQRGRLVVRPSVAEVGKTVSIIGRGLRPRSHLMLSAGRNPANLDALQTVRVDSAGNVFLRVRVPAWARPGRNLFFALETAGGRMVALSPPIRVIDDRDQEDDAITVTGELLDPSATCPRLAGDDGRIYALAGSLRQFDTGDRVRVTGELAEVSSCNQRRTIAVERIRSAE